jgi:short-subunit dehydrogenase
MRSMTSQSEGKWVLITGASSGIGESFARRFTKEGWDIILVARSRDKLEALALELSHAHGVQAWAIPSDLSEPQGWRGVTRQVEERGITLSGLVNNAGFGAVGCFHEMNLDQALEMVDLNIKALVALTHFFLPGMAARGRGLIINVSSTASFQPIPYFAMYAATKAFVTSFSEALWAEWRSCGVRILNFCPGRTNTNFRHAAGLVESPKDRRPSQTAEQVVDECFRALGGQGGPTVITGFPNRLLAWVQRFVPRRLLVLAVGQVAKRLGYASSGARPHGEPARAER